MAVRGYALRAAERAGAAAGPVTSVALLIAGCALLGVAAAGAGGAVVAIVLAAVLVAAVFACCDRLALSAMLARPVSEVEHPELYRLVRELSKDGRLPVEHTSELQSREKLVCRLLLLCVVCVVTVLSTVSLLLVLFVSFLGFWR